MGQATSATKKKKIVLPRDDELPREFPMNPDVWYWIFASSLCPLDLLNLARTCKYFRQILMTKSSSSVWKNARLRVEGPPNCPADLSEPAYADLVFCSHCHGCGRYTEEVFWRIRRRYCSDCQTQHLCSGLSYIIDIDENVLPAEVEKERPTRFEKSQVDSFIREYERADDQKQFLSDRRKRCRAISEHAGQCATWHKKMEETKLLERQEKERARQRTILEHLKKLGYELEIKYFGERYFQESRSKTDTVQPLTDEEWAIMLPGWLATMNKLREKRLKAVFRGPRMNLLRSGYDKHVKLPGAPYFDLLPHADELPRFPLFRDILNAPEGRMVENMSFGFAFATLPVLVMAWRKQLDAQLAELVTIPAHLSWQGTPRQVMASTNKDKLRLACALFDCENAYCATHPEIFRVAKYSSPDADLASPTGSIWERYRITFSEEAPYVVHACGLDPNVATRDDMYRRNARLKCLTCSNAGVMGWDDAVAHASVKHPKSRRASRSGSPRWQLLSDAHVSAVEAVENSITGKSVTGWRCLLCRPRVGDSMRYTALEDHLEQSHRVPSEVLEDGVHYRSCISYCRSWVKMVEKNGRVEFKVSRR